MRSEPELYGWEDMLGLADAALYAAKTLRNAWVGFLSTQQAPPRDLPRAARVDPQRLLEVGALRVVSSHPELERDARARRTAVQRAAAPRRALAGPAVSPRRPRPVPAGGGGTSSG